MIADEGRAEWHEPSSVQRTPKSSEALALSLCKLGYRDFLPDAQDRLRFAVFDVRDCFWGLMPWLQPYPDRLLEGVAPSTDAPEEAVISRETIELAFLAAIQLLPPRQRAVLIVRDVLDWSAKEAAARAERQSPPRRRTILANG